MVKVSMEKDIKVDKEISIEHDVRFVSGYTDQKLSFAARERSGRDNYDGSRIKGDKNHHLQTVPYTDRRMDIQTRRIDDGDDRIRAFHDSLRDASAYDPGFFPDGELFYRQALMMADYEAEETEEEEARFERIYPRYRDMTYCQLLTYFRVRTKLRRRKTVSPSDLSYITLYCYELLAGIGTGKTEGLEELKWIAGEYSWMNRELAANISGWIRDYCIYYDLPVDKNTDSGETDTKRSEQGRTDTGIRETSDRKARTAGDVIAVLEEYVKGVSEPSDKVFCAINEAGGHVFDRSAYYREYPDRVRKTVMEAYRAMDSFLKEHGKDGGIQEMCFGMRGSFPYRLFRAAPFYDHLKRVNYVYELNPVTRFRCSGGNWTREAYFKADPASAELRTICQEIDRILRYRTDFKPALKNKLRNENLVRVITDTVDKVLRDEYEASRPRFSLDMSRLSDIREDAARTRDSLIVEEELSFQTEPDQLFDGPSYKNVPDVVSEETVAGQTQKTTDPTVSGLSPHAVHILRSLLKGEDVTPYISQYHLSLPMIIDSINEVLYDKLGDTAVEFEGDSPVIVEDYGSVIQKILAN